MCSSRMAVLAAHVRAVFGVHTQHAGGDEQAVGGFVQGGGMHEPAYLLLRGCTACEVTAKIWQLS